MAGIGLVTLAVCASGIARAELLAGSAMRSLRLVAVEPIDGGFEVALEVDEEELGRLGVGALETYLRKTRPRLFSDRSLGLVRYENIRAVPRELRLRARPNDDRVLDVVLRADVVANKRKRELVCEMSGWKSNCESRWVDQGIGQVASVQAHGEVRLSLREGAALRDDPLSAAILIRRVRGSATLGGLVGINLDLDLEPPHRADEVALGLPESGAPGLSRFGDFALQDLRLAQAPERRIRVTAALTRPRPDDREEAAPDADGPAQASGT